MYANVMTSFFGDGLPPAFYSVTLTMALIAINLRGVTMSTRLQMIIASFMVVSLFALGLIGALGLGTGEQVEQPAVLSTDVGDIMPLLTTAFWLFIGSEFIVPLGKDMENPKRNVPLAMLLSLGIMCVVQCVMVLGFARYTPWAEVGAADSPHLLYAVNLLGTPGQLWMTVAALFAAVSTQNSIICSVAEICCGMAKIRLLPAIFQKKNRHGAPYLSIWLLGIATMLIEVTNLSSGHFLDGHLYRLPPQRARAAPQDGQRTAQLPGAILPAVACHRYRRHGLHDLLHLDGSRTAHADLRTDACALRPDRCLGRLLDPLSSPPAPLPPPAPDAGHGNGEPGLVPLAPPGESCQTRAEPELKA